jgi:DNA-binding XRE family transcriptional regulator
VVGDRTGHASVADLPALGGHPGGVVRGGSVPWADTPPTWNQKPIHHPTSPPAHVLANRDAPCRVWGFASELLQAYREDAGMTKRELARCSGMATGTVAMMERGMYDPSPAQVDALAAALGIDWYALCWA